MANRMNQRQVIDKLVADGRITRGEADHIASSPLITFSPREIVSYLAALIIGVGVVRLVVAMFEDASRMSISAALFLLGLILGYVAIRLNDHTGALGRLSEVMELGSVGSLAGSAALAIGETDIEGEWVAMIVATVTFIWSLVRLGNSRFVSAVVLPASMMVIVSAATSLADLDESLNAGPIALVGLVLVALGLTGLRQEVFYRAVGSVVLLMSLPGWATSRTGFEGIVPALVVTVTFFAVGTIRMWLELILPMALATTILVCAFIFRKVDNDVAQGILVVMVGLLVLGGTGLAVRRARTAGKPDKVVQPTYRVGV